LNYRTGLVVACYAAYFTVVVLSGLWPFELFTHFYVQYSVILGMTALYQIIRRRFWIGLSLLILPVMILAPLFSTDQQPGQTRVGQHLKVAFINTKSNLNSAVKLVTLSKKRGNDVVFMAGVTRKTRRRLEEFQSTYPHQRFKIMHNTFGVGLVSTLPVERFDYVHRVVPDIPISGKIPWVSVRLSAGEGSITAWVLHPPRPTQPNLFRMRNRMLGVLSSTKFQRHYPDIVIGDFNTTPASPYFRAVLESSHWASPAVRNPFYFTWPSWFPPGWIAIDHVLVGPAASVEQFGVGPHFGSPHYSIHAKISYLLNE